jgi:Domain of unknown function DUF83
MILGKSLAQYLDEKLSSHEDSESRDYIGASSIGHPCLRHIWYNYNKYPRKQFSAKQKRTLTTGKYLESLLIEEILNADINIDYNENGSHHLYDYDYPVFQGNMDAVMMIDNKQVVLEIKTAKDSSFKNFVKNGLYKWNIQYYSQIQSYLGMADINHAYILVINKDTGELHDEFITFDELHYSLIKHKVNEVINAKEPPEKINKSPIFYICNMCQYKEICHKD